MFKYIHTRGWPVDYVQAFECVGKYLKFLDHFVRGHLCLWNKFLTWDFKKIDDKLVNGFKTADSDNLFICSGFVTEN